MIASRTRAMPAMSPMNAWVEGKSRALTMPSRVARTNTCHKAMTRVWTRIAKTKARIIAEVWVATRTFRRSQRSAKTPIQGPRKNVGRNASIAAMPNAVPEWLSSQTTHDWAVCCIQMPMSEMTWPDRYIRTLRIRKGDRLSYQARAPLRSRPVTGAPDGRSVTHSPLEATLRRVRDLDGTRQSGDMDWHRRRAVIATELDKIESAEESDRNICTVRHAASASGGDLRKGFKWIQIGHRRPGRDGSQGSPDDPSSAPPRASPQRQWAVSSNQATSSIVCEWPVVATKKA